MSKTKLTIDTDFVVSEEVILVFALSGLFFAVFLYGLIDSIAGHKMPFRYYNLGFMLLLIPSLILFRKGMRNKISIRINKNGIYDGNIFVTDWSNLIKAYITQKKMTITIQDNFLLVIEYLKEGDDKGFRRKIRLTNTHNKSEEDIMGAIFFFNKLYREGQLKY